MKFRRRAEYSFVLVLSLSLVLVSCGRDDSFEEPPALDPTLFEESASTGVESIMGELQPYGENLKGAAEEAEQQVEETSEDIVIEDGIPVLKPEAEWHVPSDAEIIKDIEELISDGKLPKDGRYDAKAEFKDEEGAEWYSSPYTIDVNWKPLLELGYADITLVQSTGQESTGQLYPDGRVNVDQGEGKSYLESFTGRISISGQLGVAYVEGDYVHQAEGFPEEVGTFDIQFPYEPLSDSFLFAPGYFFDVQPVEETPESAESDQNPEVQVESPNFGIKVNFGL